MFVSETAPFAMHESLRGAVLSPPRALSPEPDSSTTRMLDAP